MLAIELDRIGKKFDGRWIFRGASLRVQTSESIVILGPSGSGKSTLLKLIAGLLTPDEGTLHVKSENLGMLFQRNALFDSLSVEDNLLFPLKERLGVTGAEARKRVAEMLASVGLSGTETLFPDGISGGMQKRLGIARALIIEPKIVLYDDPTAGLDPITSRMIAALIGDLKTSLGTTAITVTNDPHRAFQMADRIFLLSDGELFEGGSAEQVKATTHTGLKNFIHGLRPLPRATHVHSV